MGSNMTSVWLTFLNFGPYHLARLNACESIPGYRIVPVAIARNQSEYGWDLGMDSRIRFVESERYLESVRGSEWHPKIEKLLSGDRPDVVLIAGYSHPAMLCLIDLCGKASIPWVLMSDSRQVDAPRRRWQEATKKRIVRLASSGFVAGHPHAEYLQMLGMPKDRISLGYDVVDNAFFRDRVGALRQSAVSTTDAGFFLASNRFIEKKNLLRLITAYSLYSAHQLQKRESDPESASLSRIRALVLLGDGPMRSTIESHCNALGIKTVPSAPWEAVGDSNQVEPTVFLPGFRQIDELPAFYSQAEAFVHASTVDQWGLVVNEAMASGLPVLVSRGCGCAPDLVREGINGWTFDPTDERELASLLVQVGTMSPSERAALSAAGQRIIEDWGPERFASGCQEAVMKALQVGPRKAGVVDRMLLSALIRR